MPQVMQRKRHLIHCSHIKGDQVINGGWRALEAALQSHALPRSFRINTRKHNYTQPHNHVNTQVYQLCSISFSIIDMMTTLLYCRCLSQLGNLLSSRCNMHVNLMGSLVWGNILNALMFTKLGSQSSVANNCRLNEDSKNNGQGYCFKYMHVNMPQIHACKCDLNQYRLIGQCLYSCP